MIEAVAEWFRAQGAAMATDAEMENDDAQQFWSDLGFERRGVSCSTESRSGSRRGQACRARSSAGG
jgi:hypothetical protein